MTSIECYYCLLRTCVTGVMVASPMSRKTTCYWQYSLMFLEGFWTRRHVNAILCKFIQIANAMTSAWRMQTSNSTISRLQDLCTFFKEMFECFDLFSSHKHFLTRFVYFVIYMHPNRERFWFLPHICWRFITVLSVISVFLRHAWRHNTHSAAKLCKV